MLRYFNAWVLYPLAERYEGRNIRAKTHAVRREMAEPLAARLVRRRQQIAAVLARAGGRVPYYRDLFRRHRFAAESVARDLRYLSDLPLLTKDIVREQGERMLDVDVERTRLHVRKTGGSTGPSTHIYYSQDALDWTAAINQVAVAGTGRRMSMKEVHLASRYPETFPWRSRLKEHAKCMALNRRNIFTASFDATELDRVWQQLERHRPYLVQGHPSTLYALAMHLRAAGVSGGGVFRVFESTGETLDTRKRQAIEDVFDCEAFDRYGNAEFGILAYEQTSRNGLQFFDCVGWPETVDCGGGRQELVVTGLLNDAMPLVRYRTGDLARIEQREDAIYLCELAGRVHDLVNIGSNLYPTHYLQDLLDRLGGIDEFQVEQRSHSRLLLRLVVPNAERQVDIARQLHAWWGEKVELEFTTLDRLTRQGWRGKFRYLVERQAVA